MTGRKMYCQGETNKCKSCMYGKSFVDMFNGKTRYKCGIGEMITTDFGDGALIIDGYCEKYRSSNEES